jgi:cytochrome c-type biogenesis protein CcmH/NrfG
VAEAIHILDSAVRHLLRTNLAARCDLATLQIMAGRFDDAEEILAGCVDFAAPDNPAVAVHQAMLMEAQDRLSEAALRPPALRHLRKHRKFRELLGKLNLPLD